MAWHVEKTAHANAYAFSICAAGLASLLPGWGQISALRALHMRAHSMPCCMSIAHDMNNAARMLSMYRGMRRGSQPRVPENRRNRRFSKRGAESPYVCHDAWK